MLNEHKTVLSHHISAGDSGKWSAYLASKARAKAKVPAASTIAKKSEVVRHRQPSPKLARAAAPKRK
jgi:hypothetical protein